MNHLTGKTLGYRFDYTTRMIKATLHERIKKYGVTVGQFPILINLWEKQGVTQRELCDLIRVEQPTLANTLKRMERDGLIKRTPDKNDKRQWRIYLTERALELEEALQEESRCVNKLVVERLNETEQKEFNRLMKIITSTLEGELTKDCSHIKDIN